MAKLRDLSEREVIGEYYDVNEATTMASWVGEISVEFESDQESEDYRWLGAAPGMRVSAGHLQPTRPRAQGMTIRNIEYDASIEIPLSDWRRDKTGQIMVRVDELAEMGVVHWSSLLGALIVAGTGAACYDGQYFFDTDHSEGDSGTQTNDLTSSDYGTLSVTLNTQPTADEMASAVLSTIMHMYGFKNDKGLYINQMARNFLVVAGANPVGAAALQAVSKNQLDTGSGTRDNPLKNDKFTVKAEIIPELASWTSSFAVFRTDARTKPLIRQVEPEASDFKVLGPDSEYCTLNSHCLAALKETRAVGYGYWQQAVYAALATAG